MKNKLLILNIISYILLYHIVYEFIYYFFLEKGDIGVTPIGHAFEHLVLKSNRGEGIGFFFSSTGFIINMFVSGILFYCIYKWYNKMSFSKLFFLLLFVFIVISIILCVLLLFLVYIANSMFFFIFITLYFPMPIMFVLILPLFKLNKILLGDQD